MLIRILPNINPSLRAAIAEHIKKAGHTKSDTVTTGADYVIGSMDSNWEGIPQNRMILLKNPDKVDTVPGNVPIFNCFTLVRTDDGSAQPLYEFLKTVPQLA